MLVCNDCGCSFSEEDAGTVRDDRGFCGSARAYEDEMCCPNCGSVDIEEGFECSMCEEYFADGEIQHTTDSGEHLCKDCYIRILHQLDEFRERAAEIFEDIFPEGKERDIAIEIIQEGDFSIL